MSFISHGLEVGTLPTPETQSSGSYPVCLKVGRRLLAGLLTVGALVPSAHASTVGNTADIPYDGQGAVSAAGVSDLAVNRPNQGDDFDRAVASEGDTESFGLITDRRTGRKHCSFLANKYIIGLSTDPPDIGNICRKYLFVKDDKNYYAKGINKCEDGINEKCVDGSRVGPEELTEACNHRAYNDFAPAKRDFDNVDYPEHGSGPYTYVGNEYGPVYYRYTRKTPDDEGHYYAKVRSERWGWIWMRKNCFRRYPQGGAPKTEDTVPGFNPNGGPRSAVIDSTPSSTAAAIVDSTLSFYTLSLKQLL